MPKTLSNPIHIGFKAPAFTLPDPLTGKQVSLSDFSSARAVLVAFISNACPSVKLIDAEFNRYAREYAEKGVQVIAINANDTEIKAGEGADEIAATARELAYVFPYLRDESQAIARAYDAACTPDLYLFDAEGKLFYHGQFDDARPNGDIAVTGADLRAATERLLAGEAAPAVQKNAIGCNIKWRDGDEKGVRAEHKLAA